MSINITIQTLKTNLRDFSAEKSKCNKGLISQSRTHMTCQWRWSQQRWAAKRGDVTPWTNKVRQPLLCKYAFHGDDTCGGMERENGVVFLVRRTPFIISNSIQHGIGYSTVRQFSARRINVLVRRRQSNATRVLGKRCVTGSKARWFYLQYHR